MGNCHFFDFPYSRCRLFSPPVFWLLPGPTLTPRAPGYWGNRKMGEASTSTACPPPGQSRSCLFFKRNWNRGIENTGLFTRTQPVPQPQSVCVWYLLLAWTTGEGDWAGVSLKEDKLDPGSYRFSGECPLVPSKHFPPLGEVLLQNSRFLPTAISDCRLPITPSAPQIWPMAPPTGKNNATITCFLLSFPQ